MGIARDARRALASILLCASAVQAAAEPARLVAGVGTRIRSIDGRAEVRSEAELAPGEHRVVFDSIAEPAPPDGPRLHEICEARFVARPGALYSLVQEVVSVRGRHAWRHILSSGVQDEEQERWIGESVCRIAPIEETKPPAPTPTDLP